MRFMVTGLPLEQCRAYIYVFIWRHKKDIIPSETAEDYDLDTQGA